MPWARIDDGLNDHPKFNPLTDSAFRLWVCGLVYCQKNLTDGFIPEDEIQFFRLKAKTRAPLVTELCTPRTEVGKGPLWHRVAGGYQMHDYLDWNDSREKVLADREQAKRRQERFKNGKRFRVVNAAMNAVRNALHLPFDTAGETPPGSHSQRTSTYHEPPVPAPSVVLDTEKQERAERSRSHEENAKEREKQGLIRYLRRRRSKETNDGQPAVHVIAALARDVLRQHPDEQDDGELREHLKQACAKANLLYNSRAVGDALDQAKAQLRRGAS